MEASPVGHWVSFDDYKILMVKVEALEKQLREATVQCSKLDNVARQE